MNVANESSPAPSLRRLPFSIRFAPQFVNFLSAVLPVDDDPSEKVEGLLFGIVESEFAVLRVFRLFPPGLNLQSQELFREFLTQAKKDPQTAGLSLLGWFSARNTSGLQARDIAFHTSNFDKISDIALIVKSEPASDLSFEIYCRTSDGSFSDGKHRWGTIRLATDLPLMAPVEVPVETKMERESFISSRHLELPIDEEEPAAGWKDAFTAKTKKAFEFLSSTKPEDTEAKDGIVEPAIELQAAESEGPDSMSSIISSLPFATRGGAVAAPARIPEETSKTQGSTEEGRKEFRLEPETPRTVAAPRQAPPALNFGEAVLVRPEEPRTPPVASPPASKVAPKSVPAKTSEPQPQPVPEPLLVFRQAELTQYPTKPVSQLPWRVMAAVFAVAALGTFGLIYLKSARANGKLPAVLQVLWPSPGLNLHISTSADRFQLSWNRAIPAVRNAREATLYINDGPNHHEIYLGGPEVANGSVLYLPTTDDVVFRLDVHGTGGQNLSESLRVVGTTKSAELQVSHPEQKPETTPAPSAPKLATNGSHSRGKNALDISRKGSIMSKSERPRSGQLRAANNGTTAGSRTPPAIDVESPAQLSSVSKSEAASSEAAGTETPRATSGGTKLTAENTSHPIASPASGITPPHASNTATSSSGPKSNAVESARLPGFAGQTAPMQNDLVKSAPVQTPAAPSAQQPQGSPARTQALLTYRPPRPVKQVLPKVTALPPGMADAAGEVRIVVHVDESGRVVDARLMEDQKKVGSILGSAALIAAKQWIFEPASLHGKNISSDHTILFQFRH